LARSNKKIEEEALKLSWFLHIHIGVIFEIQICFFFILQYAVALSSQRTLVTSAVDAVSLNIPHYYSTA
jgi:hypothetical protein